MNEANRIPASASTPCPACGATTSMPVPAAHAAGTTNLVIQTSDTIMDQILPGTKKGTQQTQLAAMCSPPIPEKAGGRVENEKKLETWRASLICLRCHHIWVPGGVAPLIPSSPASVPPLAPSSNAPVQMVRQTSSDGKPPRVRSFLRVLGYCVLGFFFLSIMAAVFGSRNPPNDNSGSSTPIRVQPTVPIAETTISQTPFQIFKSLVLAGKTSEVSAWMLANREALGKDYSSPDGSVLIVILEHGNPEMLKSYEDAGGLLKLSYPQENTLAGKVVFWQKDPNRMVSLLEYLKQRGIGIDAGGTISAATRNFHLVLKPETRLRVIDSLLSMGCDINNPGAAQLQGGATALHSVARRGDHEMAAFLIQRGANVNAPGKSPTHEIDPTLTPLKAAHDALAKLLKANPPKNDPRFRTIENIKKTIELLRESGGR